MLSLCGVKGKKGKTVCHLEEDEFEEEFEDCAGALRLKKISKRDHLC